MYIYISSSPADSAVSSVSLAINPYHPSLLKMEARFRTELMYVSFY